MVLLSACATGKSGSYPSFKKNKQPETGGFFQKVIPISLTPVLNATFY